MGGHEKILQLLLADQRVNVNCRDLGGSTPLHIAAGCGYDEVVQLLLDCDRVDVDTENKTGMTAFRYAEDMGLQDIMQLFLSNARFAEVRRSGAISNSGASIWKLIEAAAAEREDPENSSCWHCRKCPVELSVCKGCKKARYCDEKCQNEDWAEHEAFCRKRQRRQKRRQRKEEKLKKREKNDEEDGGDGVGEE